MAFSKGNATSLSTNVSLLELTRQLYAYIGHWENPEEAHGDKRNPKDLERWRGLAKIGTQMEKHILPEQATLNKIYGKSTQYT